MSFSNPRCLVLLKVLMFLGVLLLSACSDTKVADQTAHIYLEGRTVDEGIVDRFRKVSERYGYLLQDSGARSKAELLRISADKSKIPEGFATDFHVKKNGYVVLMGTNFGGRGDRLLISFFYQNGENEASPFFKAVMSEINSIPNAKVHIGDPEQLGTN